MDSIFFEIFFESKCFPFKVRPYAPERSQYAYEEDLNNSYNYLRKMYRVAESLCDSEGQVYVLGEYSYNFKGMVIFLSEMDVLS